LSTQAIILYCNPTTAGTEVHTVASEGSRELLGTPQHCNSDSDRVDVALQHGFITRAEREYAGLLSVAAGDHRSGEDPHWGGRLRHDGLSHCAEEPVTTFWTPARKHEYLR
jgi:hypothetical protein